MVKSSTNPKADAFMARAKQWGAEMEKLRTVVLDCGLVEEMKWGKPCYTFGGSNIVIIQGFRDYCALLFFKGMLLNDAKGLLVRTGPNTRVGRQVRFTGVREIAQKATALKALIYEAIEVEKAGLKIEPLEKPELPMPEELQNKLKRTPALKTAFHALTPGRQRAYIFYFSSPTQSKTRESRIEKSVQQIMAGKGLNDR